MVLDAVTSRHDHPTADQIYQDVRGRDGRISRGTVYRNLGILSQDGAITNVKTPAADRFDVRLDRHYHLYCTACGGVFDAPVAYREQDDEQVARETGFAVIRHRTVFEGLCPACVKTREDKAAQERRILSEDKQEVF